MLNEYIIQEFRIAVVHPSFIYMGGSYRQKHLRNSPEFSVNGKLLYFSW